MFFLAADVEVGVQVASDRAAGAFKLRVAKDNGNAEASLPIYAVNVFQCFDERRCLAIRQNGGCNESYISGYGEEKRILFMNIISIQSVMSRYCAMMAFGMFARLARMPGRVLRVVLPFMEPTSRPKIWCAFIASCLVMGQFGRDI
jgi:hypothetical protein